MPKILFLDIETFPNLVTNWSLQVYGGYINPDAITQERSMICASWKWKGKSKVAHSCVDRKTPLDDKRVVEAVYGVLHEADAVVAHNGDKFDMPWVMARGVFHKFNPPPPIIQIDTKKIAKAKFYFNSNKLDYLAKFLGIGQKIKTDFELWKGCLAGNKRDLGKMVEYNKHDVVILEKVYDRLAPYVPARLNARLFSPSLVCPLCQSENTQKRGVARTIARVYQRYQCNSCGSWFRDSHSLNRYAA